ncbi:MAG: HEAT repeat domain-containing protein [Thermodesulfobacteriota bacterium]|nr:HEAT repeat domain-containing protein [Thermodesulfobacteriota bacterium]
MIVIHGGKKSQQILELRSFPSKNKRQAIEDILLLLINETEYKEDARELFKRLGYIAFYEEKLRSRNVVKKAAAIDKLGKMMSKYSVKKLLQILEKEKKNAELISVTIRALSRIGLIEGLIGILAQLPDIVKRSLASRKTIELSFINFGPQAIPALIDYGRNHDDPHIRASILEALSGLPLTQASCSFALENLNNNEAEVRAKSLILLGLSREFSIDIDSDLMLPLLNDDVWYVRLQAAKAFGNLKYGKAIGMLGNLLLDKNWQVRNAASRALAGLKDASLDVFLKILKSEDQYARESVCEEIERTNLAKHLIENLDSHDQKIYEKSKEILSLMHYLNFSTPLLEYLKKEIDSIKEEINIFSYKIKRRPHGKTVTMVSTGV